MSKRRLLNDGRVVKAKVTYNVYADNVWDSDEGRYVGVMKLGTFYEYIDVVNRVAYNPSFEIL